MRRRTAVARNRPTQIAVMGFDYLDYRDFEKTDFGKLGDKSHEFLERFVSEIAPISYLGTGPALKDIATSHEWPSTVRHKREAVA